MEVSDTVVMGVGMGALNLIVLLYGHWLLGALKDLRKDFQAYRIESSNRITALEVKLDERK